MIEQMQDNQSNLSVSSKREERTDVSEIMRERRTRQKSIQPDVVGSPPRLASATRPTVPDLASQLPEKLRKPNCWLAKQTEQNPS
jgi:hypothetical protein